MKRLALALLVGAALLDLLASWMAPRHAAWAAVAAFAEAAMVGAMADWFAVVALFRHPLGLRIPHTAIIPANKARIGRNLARFISDNFLATPQVLAHLDRFDPARRLADWLADPDHAARLAGRVCAIGSHGLQAAGAERVRTLALEAAQARLAALNAPDAAARTLAWVVRHGHQQAVLDALLRPLAAVLRDATLRERLAELIASQVKFLRYVGLSGVAGRLAAGRVVAGLETLVADLRADPRHPLRERLDAAAALLCARLADDDALRQRVQAAADALRTHPAFAATLDALAARAFDGLQAGLADPASGWCDAVARMAAAAGRALQADAGLRAWIHRELREAAPPSIDALRDEIRATIVGRVDAWDSDALTRELERHIGRDLQFVRINGTLVGGLVGLVLFGAREWLHRL